MIISLLQNSSTSLTAEYLTANVTNVLLLMTQFYFDLLQTLPEAWSEVLTMSEAWSEVLTMSEAWSEVLTMSEA